MWSRASATRVLDSSVMHGGSLERAIRATRPDVQAVLIHMEPDESAAGMQNHRD